MSYQTFIFRDKLSGQLIGGNKMSRNDNISFFSFPLTAYKKQFISTISPQAINYYLSKIRISGRIINCLIE